MDEWIGGQMDGRYILLPHIQKELILHFLGGVLGFGTGLTGLSPPVTSTSGGAEKP